MLPLGLVIPRKALQMKAAVKVVFRVKAVVEMAEEVFQVKLGVRRWWRWSA